MTLLKGLDATPLKTFTLPSSSNITAATLSDFRTVASNSWVKEKGKPVAAMVVPGAPPTWVEPSLPTSILPDQGVRYIDFSGAQCARRNASRLDPLLQSVDICSPELEYGRFDLICSRNNLRNLLRWIEGTQPKNKEFRIDVHLVNSGKTILMSEYEVKCTQFISSKSGQGYGDNFRVKAVREARGQTRHNRLVAYRLGGLNILMAHKVEGRIGEGYAITRDDLDSLISSLEKSSITDEEDSPQGTPQAQAGPLSTPSVAPQSTSSGNPSSQPQSESQKPLIPMRKSKDVLLDYDFVEIKTMKERVGIKWREYHPQLYLSQTKHLFVARHDCGTFSQIQKYTPSDAVWREHTINTEMSLGRLVEFLRVLLADLSTLEGPWALVCTKGVLGLHKSRGVFPRRVLSRFE